MGSRSQGALSRADEERGRGPVDRADDGLDGARGLMIGVVLGAALWLVLLAAVSLGRFVRAILFD